MAYTARAADGVAWVTGASSGIGRAVAERLAGEGWTVAATARSREALEEMANAERAGGGRIVAVPADLTDEAATIRAVDEIETALGPVALAILNAGVWLPVRGALESAPFHKTFAVNLSGTVNALVPVATAMIGRGRGQIAFVSSVAGFGGLPTSAAYGASKAALTNMAESLKFDLERQGVRVGVVHPGFVDTPATRANDFPMPFLMPVETAAARLVDGLKRERFEVTFPRRFTWGLKILRLLPYALYFPLVSRATGWSRRESGTPGG